MSLRASEGATTTDARSYADLFAVRGFPQLASGTVLARTAGMLWNVALVLFVLGRFHSPALAGLATFLSIVPGLAVSPIAGALLDRHGRLRLILVDYGVAALSLALLAALSAAGALSAGLMLVIVSASSLTGPLSASGTRSLFPLVVPRALWDRANAIDAGSQAVASVLGPALAGLLVARVGGEGTFVVTAILFALAGVALVGFVEPAAAHAGSPEPLLRSAWQALTYVLRHATLRGIIITLSLGNMAFGTLNVALPVLVLRRYQWGPGAVGALWSAAGVATVLTGLVAGRLDTEGRERRLVAAGMTLAAVGCALLFLANGPVVLVAGMLLIGLSSGPTDIGLFALRQRRTDPAWFGRAFAVSMSLNFAGMPVGAALAGPVVDRSIPLALALAVLLSLLGGVAALTVVPRHAKVQ